MEFYIDRLKTLSVEELHDEWTSVFLNYCNAKDEITRDVYGWKIKMCKDQINLLSCNK